MYIWTQGDRQVQEQRIKDSGLGKLFKAVEIVDEKSPTVLKNLLNKWAIDPTKAWVVGNSARTDIAPAVESGLKAIWIPADVWDKEREILPPVKDGQVYLVETIKDILEVLLPTQTDLKIDEQIANGEVAYLFVSAYHNLYRQYILDILAYPRGFVFKFPYDMNWLPPTYRSREKATELCGLLANIPALIVFTDERIEGEPRRCQNFLPIRAAVIDGAPEMRGDMLHIEFKLTDYVFYPDDDAIKNSDAEIKNLKARPKLKREDCSYVSIGPTYIGRIQTETDPKNDNQAWQSTVRVIGNLRRLFLGIKANPNLPNYPSPFKLAMFYRVESLIHLKTQNQVALDTILERDSGYRLDSNQNYRLNLLFYAPTRPEPEVRASKIQAKLTTKELLAGVGETEIPLNFRYDSRHIDLITSRVFEDTWGSIALAIANPQQGTLPEDRQVVAPAPMFLVRVVADRFAQIAAPLLFAFAAAAGSLNTVIAKWIAGLNPAFQSSEVGFSVLFALIGSAGTTGVMYYLYRKLR
jgi:hypothetical protein